jgi:HEAT repeat protein
VLAAALAGAKEETRQGLRQALALAMTSERAGEAVDAVFTPSNFASLPEVTRIDLLRAAGPVLVRVAAGRRALIALATEEAPFRTRYLLLAPAAELTKAGDAQAEAFVRRSMRHDVDPFIRARALSVAGSAGSLVSDVGASIDDPEPRVRDAALVAAQAILADEPRAPIPVARVAAHLASDPWPFVRVSAAKTLGALPADRHVDGRLAAALTDASPTVRGEAVESLGRHRAVAQREPILKLVHSNREIVDVRAKAVIALGAMCDARSLEELTKLASRLASPANEVDQRLGVAALTALSMLHPADLDKRIGALTGAKLPFGVRDLAKSALASSGTCAK